MALAAEDFEAIRLSLTSRTKTSPAVSAPFAEKMMGIYFSSPALLNDQELLRGLLRRALASPAFKPEEIAMLHEALAYFSL